MMEIKTNKQVYSRPPTPPPLSTSTSALLLAHPLTQTRTFCTCKFTYSPLCRPNPCTYHSSPFC